MIKLVGINNQTTYNEAERALMPQEVKKIYIGEKITNIQFDITIQIPSIFSETQKKLKVKF